MGRTNSRKGRLETATISGMLYSFGQGNLLLLSRNSRRILKSDFYGNNVIRAFCKENSTTQGFNLASMRISRSRFKQLNSKSGETPPPP